jgi:Zn-dependent protease
MLGGRPIRLARVFGIPIGVHPSWFFVLFLVIYSLTGYYQDALPGDDNSQAFVLAVVSALLFFLSILLHELGHAAVAIRNKIAIAGIDLWLFGGIAKMSRDTDSPGVELRVAAAGPFVTLLIAGLCIGIGMLIGGSGDFWAAMRLQPEALSNGALALLAYLSSVNLLVLGFNLIPAFPLDGGRIARAIVWWRTGDRAKATNAAAQLGQGFSYLMIGFGVFTLFSFNDVVGGVWLIFIGLFLRQAARAAVFQTAVTSKIEGVRVSDVMDAEPVVVPDSLSAERALEEFFLRYRWPWFPVVDSRDRFIGVIDHDKVERISRDRRRVFTVRELMRPDEENWHVRTDDPLETLLSSEPLRSIGALMAVDADGRLRGVITIEQVRRALQHGIPEVAPP